MTLTESQAKELGRRIVKESAGARVKFGRTNGQVVLHIYVPGSNELGRTIKSEAEWENHPANNSIRRNREFAESQATESLIENNG